MPVANLASGSPSATTYLRGDGTWATVSALSGGTANYTARWTGATTLGTGVLYDNGTNVGIGNTSPTYKLDVSDNSNANTAVEITNTNAGSGVVAEFRAVTTAGTTELLQSGLGSGLLAILRSNTPSGFFIQANNVSSFIDMSVNSVEALRINASGNVGIGIANPSEMLQTATGGNIFAGGAFRSNMPGSHGSSVTVCFNGSGYFDSCSSLRKFKRNIKPLNLGLDTVMKLQPVSYDWKATGEHDIGFIAEDTIGVDPVLGEHGTDGSLTGVRYAHMTAVLTKAVQQLKADNDNLRAANDKEANEIKALTARLDRLEAARH